MRTKAFRACLLLLVLSLCFMSSSSANYYSGRHLDNSDDRTLHITDIPSSPPTMENHKVVFLVTFFIIFGSVALIADWFWGVNRVSIIKLEVYLTDDWDEIEDDIRSIKEGANLQRCDRRKEFMLSEVVSCLQNYVEAEAVSRANCWIGCYRCTSNVPKKRCTSEVPVNWFTHKVPENWFTNEDPKKWKYSYIKLCGGARRRRTHAQSEGKENILVTLVLATPPPPVHRVPTTSDLREIASVLRQIAEINPLKIKALDVFCTWGATDLEETEELYEENSWN